LAQYYQKLEEKNQALEAERNELEQRQKVKYTFPVDAVFLPDSRLVVKPHRFKWFAG